MPVDTDSVLIAGNGSLHTAPVGSTLPTDVSTALDAAFIDVGWISDEGATLSVSKDMEPVPVWQQFEPVKYVVTSSDTTISATLRQWDQNTVRLAFGGGTVEETSVGSGVFRYEPPGPEEIDERAIVLTWLYDTYTYRFVAPRALITEGVESTFVRSAPSDLPITLGLLGTAGVKTFSILTNDPSFTPPA